MNTELSPRDFYDRIQQPDNLLLLDVRNADAFTRWRIETRHTPETINIPYFEFVEDDTREAAVGRLPVGREIAVVCAHGSTSDYVASMLRKRSLTAFNLSGGMDAWSRLHIFRPVVENELVRIYQVERVARGCLSYVVISHGQAGVIDPTRHVDEFERFLYSQDAALNWVVDTHAHADHISGGAALARHSKAAYYLHPYDAIHPLDFLPAPLEYEMLEDGRGLILGDVRLQILHMPGHTLGQVNLLLETQSAGDFLFSGDNLFIQSLGRPDLGGHPEAWVYMLHDAIFNRLEAAVFPETLVLPGHAASPHEANPDGSYARLLRDLWLTNRDLSFRDEQEFVRHVLSNLPPAPAEYAEIKRANIGLAHPTEQESFTLESGKNVCALSSAYQTEPDAQIA